MRQLITRVSAELHGRLKSRAREERRSVNSLVTAILEQAVPPESPRERLRKRLKDEGLLVEITPPPGAPSREDVIEMLRGEAGSVVLQALQEDRKKR